jgi:carboxymethylenebutenolidase
MTAIQHEWVQVKTSDEQELGLYVARPATAGDVRAGLIVLQEMWGVNKHIQEVTDRLARLGYVAAAPDVFHRTAPRFEAPYTSLRGAEHAEAMTTEGAQADLDAVHTYLVAELGGEGARIASLGFGLGARIAYVANATLPLSAAICFYADGSARRYVDLAAAQHGPLLLFWCGKDGVAARDRRRATTDALDAAGKRFTEVNVGHASQGFFCDQRPSYDAEAAKEAWGLVTAFLASNLT